MNSPGARPGLLFVYMTALKKEDLSNFVEKLTIDKKSTKYIM